jgi:hypothetical protein
MGSRRRTARIAGGLYLAYIVLTVLRMQPAAGSWCRMTAFIAAPAESLHMRCGRHPLIGTRIQRGRGVRLDYSWSVAAAMISASRGHMTPKGARRRRSRVGADRRRYDTAASTGTVGAVRRPLHSGRVSRVPAWRAPSLGSGFACLWLGCDRLAGLCSA